MVFDLLNQSRNAGTRINDVVHDKDVEAGIDSFRDLTIELRGFLLN
jgi:hypothetical protein